MVDGFRLDAKVVQNGHVCIRVVPVRVGGGVHAPSKSLKNKDTVLQKYMFCKQSDFVVPIPSSSTQAPLGPLSLRNRKSSGGETRRQWQH
jgi:hypothetical protein